MKEEKARKYVYGKCRGNYSYTADKMDVSRRTVTNYQKEFRNMGYVKCNMVIAILALKNIADHVLGTPHLSIDSILNS